MFLDENEEPRWGMISLVIIVIIFFGGWISWAAGWLDAPRKITSVENVEKQWAFAYQFDESLQATARQVCTAEKAIEQATSENTKTQRQTQAIAIEQNYARIEAQYNAKLRNAFEAKWVKPSDVPQTAPTLEEMKAKVCKK